MQRFTPEQMNVLKQYENLFYTATVCGYVRNVSSDKMNILEKTTGEKCSNRSCTHCVLTFFRTIGERYKYTLHNPIPEVVEKETEPIDAPKTSMEVIDKMIESDPELKEQVKEMIMATNKEQDEQPKPKRGRKKQTS